MRSSYVPSGPGDKMISVLDLDGAYVKSLTIGGLATLQLANNTEAVVQLSGGGGGGGGADGVLTGCGLRLQYEDDRVDHDNAGVIHA